MRPEQSQLFTLRMWQEELGDGQVEWRGSVQHVLSGEIRYFRDWQMLANCLSAMLPRVEPGGTAAPDSPGVPATSRQE